MSCKHGLHSSPDSCSLCLGCTPKRVTQVGSDIAIDGEVTRSFEPDSWSPGTRRQQQARRGGIATGQKRTHARSTR